MFKRLVSVVLVVVMAGVLTPAFSENLVNPKLLAGPGGAMARSVPSHRFDDPAARQGSSQAQGGSWTTGGKVMFFVGLGLLAEGGVTLAYAQTLKDTSYCTGGGYYSYCYSEDNSVPRMVYRSAGAVSVGVGAILMAVGLTRRN